MGFNSGFTGLNEITFTKHLNDVSTFSHIPVSLIINKDSDVLSRNYSKSFLVSHPRCVDYKLKYKIYVHNTIIHNFIYNYNYLHM